MWCIEKLRRIMLHSRYCHQFVCKTKKMCTESQGKKMNPFRKRKFFENYDDPELRKIANRVCLSVIGNGATGQPLSLCLFTDYKSYMFNCGEGTSRIFRELDLNLVDTRHVFITHKNWKNMSGLPDLYQSLNFCGVRKFMVHGPTNVENFHELILSDIKHLRISKNSLENESYTDDVLSVQYVPILSSKSDVKNNIQKRKISKFNNKKNFSCDTAVSYICKVLPKPKELSLEKCVEMGVTIGSLILDLKNGRDVTLPSGKTVKAVDVNISTTDASLFLVVDCPSENFLEAFVKEKKFKCLQEFCFNPDLATVVHFTPPHIIDTYKYQSWMSRFPTNIVHLVLNSRNPISCSSVVQEIQHKLNILHPTIFKLLPREKPEVTLCNQIITQPESLLMLHLRPTKRWDNSNVSAFNPKADVQEAARIPGFSTALKDLQLAMKNCSKNDLKQIYPEIIFLGTSSCLSTKSRNVAGILVNISSSNSVLLDCGEGTYRQLVNYYGYSEASSVLRRIACVFISHMHTDHYLGIYSLIKARKEAFLSCNKKYVPLTITLPYPGIAIIDKYEEIFEQIKADIRILLNSSLVREKSHFGYEIERIENVELFTTPVKHCKESYGAILMCGHNWKLVYSGDSQPCQSLIDAGKDCTVLIHEATIDDDMEQSAILKNHSTVSQALEVSELMNAKYTILTHFNPCYLEIPVFKEHYHRHVGIAFDNMRVRHCDLPILPLFTPVLKCLFSEQMDCHLEKGTSVSNFEDVLLKTLKS